jgi:thiol-disulfide isomerase/thioredoxin
MANSGSGRRSGSGNRRPSGTGNRSTNPRRSGAPSVSADGAKAVGNGSAGGAAAGLTEATNGNQTIPTGSGRSRSTAEERARERLSEQRGGPSRGAQARAGRPGQAPARTRPAGAGAGRGAKSRQRAPQGRKSSTNAAIFGSIFVVLAVVIIVLISTLSPASKTTAKGQLPTVVAPASLVSAVSNIPASRFAAAGKNSPNVSDQGALVALPSSVRSVTSGGKPEIVYMGADYCPYCAAFRWPFTIALSRFGHFTGLHITGSGSHDAYPNTHTLSFYGAKYSSPYIALSTTELDTNICTDLTSQGCLGYKALQTPTPANQRLFGTYDVKKYFPAAAQASQTNGGWIPFVDFGGKYIESGGFYSPAQLQGFTYADVEKALKSPNIGVGQSILQAANIYTALICRMDGGKPASVCGTAPVQAAIAALPKPTT